MRITLQQYITIMTALRAMEVVEVVAGQQLPKTTTQLYAEYPEQVLDILSCATGKDVNEKTDTSEIVGMLEIVIANISISEPVAPPVSFEIDGVEYLPPDNLYTLDNDGNEVVKEFGEMMFKDTLETLRLSELAGGNFKMIPYVLAAIYKENGKQARLNDRAKQFLKLDFADAYAAYFFLSSSNNGFIKAIFNQLATTTEAPTTSEPQKQQVRDAWLNLVGTIRSVRQEGSWFTTMKSE